MSTILEWLGSSLIGKWIGPIVSSPAFLQFLLTATLIGFAVSNFKQCSRANEEEGKAAVLTVKLDSISTEFYRMQYRKDQAYHYADSINSRTHAINDSISKVVAAMPPAVRTQLNRKLLSELQP